MKKLISMFSVVYPTSVVYMLQNVEYSPYPFLKWYRRTNDYRKVMYRRKLDRTKAARLLYMALVGWIILQVALALILFTIGINANSWVLIVLAVVIFLTYPICSAYAIIIPLLVGRRFIVIPRHKLALQKARKIFTEHSAIKIAVLGSYGKTSMKELLKTVLSESKNVKASLDNKNVAVSHAKFAQRLNGNEEVLVLEYGESKPGDIKHLAQLTHPDYAIITGLAPVHLDKYDSIDEIADDIFSISDFVSAKNIYANSDSELVKKTATESIQQYDISGAIGWRVSHIKVTLEGTSFCMKKGEVTLNINSGLLGRHHVGPLALVAALANELGMTKLQIERAISKTKPFKHRMEVRYLNGAHIIDDTYNGNIEGVKAGLRLLQELKANRKVYVTPGLVDQGRENQRVHIEIGRAIARAEIDKVVLISNSNSHYIEEGLKKGKSIAELQIVSKPLEYYTNLEHFIAKGDLVMLQNDLPDNYN